MAPPSAAPLPAGAAGAAVTEAPRDLAAEARLRVAWAKIITAAAVSEAAPEVEAEPEADGMTDAECDEFAMNPALSNAELHPTLRSIGCGSRLDELEAAAIAEGGPCGAHGPGGPECGESSSGADESDDVEDPDSNVGPDGYCTATPCGSNGTPPELTCAELGIEESSCQPDGTHQP